MASLKDNHLDFLMGSLIEMDFVKDNHLDSLMDFVKVHLLFQRKYFQRMQQATS
jgi:hypothetical protein